jgi:hypothetical protein
MTRTARVANVATVIVPFVAFVAAVVLLWSRLVGAPDLAVLAFMYLLTGLGVTVGFHRMLTHRSFRTSKPVDYLFAVLGSMAVQGPVINWVADHRSTTPTPTRRAIRTARTSAATAMACSRCLIAAMERLGLAWDVVRISPERQRARLVSAGE